MKKFAIAVTGASGSIYASILFKKLEKIKDQFQEIGIVMSDNAKQVWLHELGNKDYENLPFRVFHKADFNAPFASGSAGYDGLIICPCSMGTMARIASGVSNDLTTRAADVMLKERKKLICVSRDMPLSLIHINNMKALTEAGGIICPASPAYYSNPTSIEELASTVVDRVMDLAGFKISTYRWGKND